MEFPVHDNQSSSLLKWLSDLTTAYKIQFQRGCLRLGRFFRNRYAHDESRSSELTFRRIFIEALFPGFAPNYTDYKESAYTRTHNDPKRYSSLIVGAQPAVTTKQSISQQSKVVSRSNLLATSRSSSYATETRSSTTRSERQPAWAKGESLANTQSSTSRSESNTKYLSSTTTIREHKHDRPLPFIFRRRRATTQDEGEWRIAAFVGTIGLLFLILLFLNFPQKPPMLRLSQAGAAPAKNQVRNSLLSGRNNSQAIASPKPQSVILPEPEFALSMERTFVPTDIRAEYTPDDDTPFEVSSIDHANIELPNNDNLLNDLQGFDDWVLYDAALENPRPQLDLDRDWSERFDTQYDTDAPLEGLSRPNVLSRVQDGEVMLTIDKSSPTRSTVNEQLEYEIVIRNMGNQPLDRLLVEETIPGEHRFINATPRATIPNRSARTTGDNTIMWQVANLDPGEEKRLHVQLLATSEGTLKTETRIQPVSTFSSQTTIEGTRLAIDVELPESIDLGEVFPIRYSVTNDSDVTAEQVVLDCELPAGLSHRIGKRLQHNVGKLEPGKTHYALLYVKAEQLGDVSHFASAAGDGAAMVKQTGVVHVVQAPTPKKPMPKRRPSQRRPVAAPINNCCCPNVWIRSQRP